MALIGDDTKAVLLVGGKGTRLRSVISSTPKPMAVVGDRPFLELLVQQLSYQGIRRLIMSTGYLSHEIENKLGDGHTWDVAIEYSKEPHPLGTGGAVKFAEPLLRGVSDFLVMNGDSFIEIDFLRLIRFHRESGGLASMAVVRMQNEGRYGTVQIGAGGRVSGFAEKTGSHAVGFVNAGVYVFNRTIFEHIPEGPASLEKDIFPKLLAYGVYALEHRGVFIDIGTPEDYARAQGLCARLYETASRKQGPRSSS
jgi:D-glycero-alpha-D-manno-heptose 1-phosphate guanylyltransferase